jgi:hypothetical protein
LAFAAKAANAVGFVNAMPFWRQFGVLADPCEDPTSASLSKALLPALLPVYQLRTL